jgi:mRNA interferase MazF
MRRGEVRWVDFEHPDKRRPAVVLTRGSAIGYLNALTVAPITTTIRRLPTEVLLGPEDGLPTVCVANLDCIYAAPKSKIGALIASLTEDRLAQVEAALLFALGMEQYRSRE